MKFLMISQTAKSKQVNSKYLTNVFRKQTNTSKSYWKTQNQQNLKGNVAYYIFNSYSLRNNFKICYTVRHSLKEIFPDINIISIYK